MADDESHSGQNRRLQTWPFRRQHPAYNETANVNTDHRWHDAPELDLTRHESLSTIFVTDSSKTLDVRERTISEDLSTASIHIGNIITATYHQKPDDAAELYLCPICCDSIRSDQLKQKPCCAVQLCSTCLSTHIITSIRDGKAKIQCPACTELIDSTTILYNKELPMNIRERYQEILAQDLSEKQNTHLKLCPHCNFITILDKNDPLIRDKKSRRAAQAWINCEQCHKDWCWPCYAPSHPNESCRDFKRNHTQLDVWAKSRQPRNVQQRNARRCPKCGIYIEKIDGCDHMSCTKCNSKFCYRCGSRMRIPLYIGHDAKYSIFGCKYKLWPNRPWLRWLVRGSITLGVLLLTPVVVGALVALVAIGFPTIIIIGCFALPVSMCVKCKKGV